ncbi:hypothetical protein IE53DRAFT_198154 [Violaceomyces palustris]|uniref:Uncharacterized protein n=1 Tax=Violaceomyces palustris TaxID=1673888 RepID=A0ACD0NRI7_9BASI|nr:hypothetical protein IE53DRAFT_198154 [Violaceomyces palustris]
MFPTTPKKNRSSSSTPGPRYYPDSISASTRSLDPSRDLQGTSSTRVVPSRPFTAAVPGWCDPSLTSPRHRSVSCDSTLDLDVDEVEEVLCTPLPTAFDISSQPTLLRSTSLDFGIGSKMNAGSDGFRSTSQESLRSETSRLSIMSALEPSRADDLPGAKARKVLGLDQDDYELGPGSDPQLTPRKNSGSIHARGSPFLKKCLGQGRMGASLGSSSPGLLKASKFPFPLPFGTRRSSTSVVNKSDIMPGSASTTRQSFFPSSPASSKSRPLSPEIQQAAIRNGPPGSPSPSSASSAHTSFSFASSNWKSSSTSPEIQAVDLFSDTESALGISTPTKRWMSGMRRRQSSAETSSGQRPFQQVQSHPHELDWEKMLNRAAQTAEWNSSISHRPRTRPGTGKSSESSPSLSKRASSSRSSLLTPPSLGHDVFTDFVTTSISSCCSSVDRGRDSFTSLPYQGLLREDCVFGTSEANETNNASQSPSNRKSPGRSHIRRPSHDPNPLMPLYMLKDLPTATRAAPPPPLSVDERPLRKRREAPKRPPRSQLRDLKSNNASRPCGEEDGHLRADSQRVSSPAKKSSSGPSPTVLSFQPGYVRVGNAESLQDVHVPAGRDKRLPALPTLCETKNRSETGTRLSGCWEGKVDRKQNAKTLHGHLPKESSPEEAILCAELPVEGDSPTPHSAQDRPIRWISAEKGIEWKKKTKTELKVQVPKVKSKTVVENGPHPAAKPASPSSPPSPSPPMPTATLTVPDPFLSYCKPGRSKGFDEVGDLPRAMESTSLSNLDQPSLSSFLMSRSYLPDAPRPISLASTLSFEHRDVALGGGGRIDLDAPSDSPLRRGSKLSAGNGSGILIGGGIGRPLSSLSRFSTSSSILATMAEYQGGEITTGRGPAC